MCTIRRRITNMVFTVVLPAHWVQVSAYAGDITVLVTDQRVVDAIGDSWDVFGKASSAKGNWGTCDAFLAGQAWRCWVCSPGGSSTFWKTRRRLLDGWLEVVTATDVIQGEGAGYQKKLTLQVFNPLFPDATLQSGLSLHTFGRGGVIRLFHLLDLQNSHWLTAVQLARTQAVHSVRCVRSCWEVWLAVFILKNGSWWRRLLPEVELLL